MARDKQDITEAEMTVMQVLWRRGETLPTTPTTPDASSPGIAGASTRHIAVEIYGARAGAAQYATVQKQLERLEAKGFVRRDRTLFVHLFSAAVAREELVGRRLREMVDKLCEGSLAPVLSHLFKAEPLTDEQRRALRALIDDEDDDGGGGSGGKRKRTR
jgi:predicted transcriptional regulator